MTKIALIGGSNTILNFGYWRTFAEVVGDVEFTNLAIGANPSLTGLHQILTEDVFERFDGVIFEYALNDTQHKAVFMRPSSVESSIAAVLQMHRPYRGRKKLLALLGTPWRNVDEVLEGNCYVNNIYRKAFSEAGIAHLDATTFLGDQFDHWRDVYESNNHYNPAAMALLGREMARLWADADRGSPDDVMPESPLGWDRMRAVPIGETEIAGPCETVERATKLRTMTMHRLGHGASIHLPGEGVLYGVFTNIGPDAGEITIRGERVVRKATFTRHWNPNRKALFANIVLREPMRFTNGLHIEVGADPALRPDATPSGLPAGVPVEQAVLEASHLMVGPLVHISRPEPYVRQTEFPDLTPRKREAEKVENVIDLVPRAARRRKRRR